MFTLYMNLCVLSIGSSLVCFYLFLAALPVQYEGSLGARGARAHQQQRFQRSEGAHLQLQGSGLHAAAELTVV